MMSILGFNYYIVFIDDYSQVFNNMHYTLEMIISAFEGTIHTFMVHVTICWVHFHYCMPIILQISTCINLGLISWPFKH